MNKQLIQTTLKNRFRIYFFFLLLTGCYNPNRETNIEIWYGLEQSFGKTGNAQRQINVLGNIQCKTEQFQAYYTLNNSNTKNYLTLGCDLHRLAQQGDFNIEIERVDLEQGKNVIELFVTAKEDIFKTEKIIVNYYGNNQWPLPYSIAWNKVNNIQDIVEVVDGNWEITNSGVHTKNKYYDRVLAFGDSSWRNYEVETTVVFHGYTPPMQGPPTYNVSHVAIATRWPGHDYDSLQPNRKWYPLGATSEFRITDNYDSCRWRIFDGENIYEEQSVSDYRSIQPGIIYKMKHRVEDISDIKSLYSVKFWKATEEEPAEWDFQAIETSLKKESGSACLIAHHTDVTFGDVQVIPITPDMPK